MSTEHQSGDEIVLVIFLILLVAAIFSILKEKIANALNVDIPFTVLMFVTGLIFGAIMAAHDGFADSVTITNISPKLIFDVFLPVLIFDGSQGLKLRTLSRVKWPAFWLAGPGLLIHTALVGVFMWIFLSEWSWWARLLLGAILSATDPVAVIAVLKDLDADNTITTLIDGEAILNDGAAIILFAVFHPGTTGHTDEFNDWTFYALLVWLVVGAPIVGTIFAIILMTLLKQCYNQPIVEATLTLSGSYVAFIVAEDYIKTSGVLVLATLGYHLASHKGARLSRHSELAEHAWEVIVFFANAIIFALVGLIIGKDAIPSAEGFDWALLFILYAALHVFRAAVVGAFWKLLGDITFPRYVLLVFGALRGGVALSLALVIHRDEEVDLDIRNKVLFLTGGVVLLSIVVNGSISKVIVTRMGLNKQPGHKLYMKQRVEASLRYKAQEAVRNVQGDKDHDNNGVNWLEVYNKTIQQFHDDHTDSHHQQQIEYEHKEKQALKSAPQSPNTMFNSTFAGVHPIVDDTEVQSEDQDDNINGGVAEEEDEQGGEVAVVTHNQKKIRTLTEAEFTTISLRTMKSKLWILREIDMVSVDAFELLLSLIDDHLDTCTFIGPHEVHLAITAQRASCRIPLDLCGISSSPEIVYFESLLTFLDLTECSDRVLQAMMPQKKRLQAVTEEPKVLLQSMIHNFAQEHPEVARGVRTNRLILTTLQEVKSGLTEMHEEQGLPKSQFNSLNERIVHLAHSTAHRNVMGIHGMSERMVFSQCILFGNSAQGSHIGISDTIGKQLSSTKTEETMPDIIKLAYANAERRVFAEGDFIKLEGLGVVLSGCVVKREMPAHYSYYSSDVFGLMHLLNGQDPHDYYAGEACVCAFIPSAVILMLINGEPALLESMWARYGVREAEASLSRYFPCCTFHRNDIKRIAANGVIRAFAEPHRIEPGNRSIFLLHGTDESGTYSHRSLRLLPHLPSITFQKYAVLFVIENYSLNGGAETPKPVGVPIIDAASINYFKLIISLEEANAQGKDVADNTLSLLIEYCKMMGTSIFYLLDHKENPCNEGCAGVESPAKGSTATAPLSGVAATPAPTAGAAGGTTTNPTMSPALKKWRSNSAVPTINEPAAIRTALNPEANVASRFAVQLAINMNPEPPHGTVHTEVCGSPTFNNGSFVNPSPYGGGDEEMMSLERTATTVGEGVTCSNTNFVPLANQRFAYNTGTPEPTPMGAFSNLPFPLGSPAHDETVSEEVPPGVDEVPPLDVEDFLEEWRSFCKMVRRMVLERFRHRLEGKETLNSLLWWWKILKERQQQLAAYFLNHPEFRAIHALDDLCTENEVRLYWLHFGFAFDPESHTKLDKAEMDALLSEIVYKPPVRNNSMVATSIRFDE